MNCLRALLLGLAVLVAYEVRSAEPSVEQKALVAKVSKKLIASADPVPGFEWPPNIEIMDGPQLNAYSTFEVKDGKKIPQVRICSGLMDKVIRGDEDMLALVLGHELG